jgi:hypothetical protein
MRLLGHPRTFTPAAYPRVEYLTRDAHAGLPIPRAYFEANWGQALWTSTRIVDTLMNSSSSHRHRSHANGLRVHAVGASRAMQG